MIKNTKRPTLSRGEKGKRGLSLTRGLYRKKKIQNGKGTKITPKKTHVLGREKRGYGP